MTLPRSITKQLAQGTLRSKCWCEHDYVDVPTRWVWEGITYSCGRPGCIPPEGR